MSIGKYKKRTSDLLLCRAYAWKTDQVIHIHSIDHVQFYHETASLVPLLKWYRQKVYSAKGGLPETVTLS